jgi:hypothetical protein
MLLSSGAEIGAGGQIGRKVIGKGVVIFCQIDPDRFEADTKTYFRLTRWRQTRALSQLLANLGGSFGMDRRVFSPQVPVQKAEPQVSLAGPWQARLTVRRPTAATPEEASADPGISGEARALLAGGNEGWQTVQVPGAMENYGGTWTGVEGEAIFRKVIDIPAPLQGKALTLSLGSLDDYDETFFNGVRVGGLGASDKDPWGVQRVYTIPANLVKASGNVITVRIWDRYGSGGFTGNRRNWYSKRRRRRQTRRSSPQGSITRITATTSTSATIPTGITTGDPCRRAERGTTALCPLFILSSR